MTERATEVEEVERFLETAGTVDAAEAPVAEDEEVVEEQEEEGDSENDGTNIEELLMDFLAQQEEESDDESPLKPGEDNISLHEAASLRQRLHQLGPQKFYDAYVKKGPYLPELIIKVLGVRIPEFVSELEGPVYERILTQLFKVAVTRELRKRAKLTYYNSVTDAVQLIAQKRNIMVVTGAGISTSLGIPDFRSKGTGLYSQLAAKGYSDPTDVFDIEVFRQDPTLFYSVAKDILPSTKRFTPTHGFIAELDRRHKLLTNYTQNIDNIESAAGISADRLVQCHGSFRTATCFTCGYKVPGEEVFDDIKAGKIPDCRKCLAESAAAKRKRPGMTESGRKTKRRTGGNGGGGENWGGGDDDNDATEEDDRPNLKIMKPDITFFGEALPDLFHDRLSKHDLQKVDLLIVIGTSLKVKPVSEISAVIPSHIPQIYISRDPIDHINFDIVLLGDCDVIVAELAKKLGWDFRHEMIPKDQDVRVVPDQQWEHHHHFKRLWPLADRPVPVSVIGEGLKGPEGEGGGKVNGVERERERAVAKMPALVERGVSARK